MTGNGFKKPEPDFKNRILFFYQLELDFKTNSWFQQGQNLKTRFGTWKIETGKSEPEKDLRCYANLKISVFLPYYDFIVYRGYIYFILPSINF